MKKITIISFVALAMLLTTGCSKKQEVKPVEPVLEKQIEVPVEIVDNSAANDIADDADSSVLSFEQLQELVKTVYFDSDKYIIKENMETVISSNADALNKKEAKTVSVVVSGHCDEWGTDEYNFALGQKRAIAVKNALESRGIAGENIKTVSKGEGAPVCGESTPECWSQNRRAEIQLNQ